MKNRTVLISGAGIAGPALAYWLSRYGFTPTVVERAPVLRPGGQAVDFRSPAQLSVLTRMGVLDQIKAQQTSPVQLALIDSAGRKLALLPLGFMAGEVEILRGDLSRILHHHTRDSVEYLFGDYATALAEHSTGVQVTFAKAAPRTFDLVIGADGLHSGVRALAFGPESQFVNHCGYYVATYIAPLPYRAEYSALYSVPGRSVTVGSSPDGAGTSVMLVFASDPLDYDRHDLDQQKKLLADAYAGMDWKVPALIEALRDAPDLYFDSISTVTVDSYVRGRVALVGDAAAGGTLGGQGNGTGMVCAYVLAGELAAAGGDHRAAFASYERKVRDYATACQQGATRTGPFFAPRTRAGIWARNRALASRFLADLLNRQATTGDRSITLDDYPG